MRILAVDLGGARTGLALSDPHGVTCTPLTVIFERDEERLVQQILTAAGEVGAERLLVGLPRPLSGGTNQQLERAERFAARLAASTALSVETWDERFTSKLAEQGRSKNGPPADAVAACHLLQNYLDAHSLQQAPTRSEP